MSSAPSPLGPEWKAWGERIVEYLNRARSRLVFKLSGDSASENGIILWDNVNQYPVVSSGGSFKQIVLADGHGDFSVTSDFTYAANGTTYAITYVGDSNNAGLTQNGSQIVFSETGYYLVSFSAQVYSTSGNTVEFSFWPSVNGTNISGSTIRTALHGNGETTVVSRAGIFHITANDYLEVKTATDDSTHGVLKAFAANGISDEPACPATTLTIIRVHR